MSWLKSHGVLQHDESLLYASILTMDRYDEAMEMLQEQLHHVSTDKLKITYMFIWFVCHNMGIFV